THFVIAMARNQPAAVGAEREGFGSLAHAGERLDLRPGPRAPELDRAGLDVLEMAADGHRLPIGTDRNRRGVAQEARALEDAARRPTADVDVPTSIAGDQVAAIGAERGRRDPAVVIAIDLDVLEGTPLEVTPFPVAERDGTVVEQLVGTVGVMSLAVVI